MKKIFLILTLFLFITACSSQNKKDETLSLKDIEATAVGQSAWQENIQANIELNMEDKVGKACLVNNDCELPIAYAIKSSCPFTVSCIEKKCAVICPLFGHSLTPEKSDSYPFICKENEDCSCSDYLGDDLKKCSCVKGICAAIVAE